MSEAEGINWASTHKDAGAFLNVNLSKTQVTMIIKVNISEETWARMKQGKRVEGTLGLNQWTGEKTFNAFCRKSRMPGYVRPAYKTIAELDNGWVKESATLIIRREAFPKRLSTARVISLMDKGNEQAKNALIDKELDLIEFC